MGSDTVTPSKRRILLVVRWPGGGIRTFLRYIYSQFESAEWNFTLIAPRLEEVDALTEDLKDIDIEFIFTEPQPSAFSFGFSVFKQLQSSSYDLVHSHGFTSAVSASIPSLIFFKRNLVTSHDVLNAEQFVGFPGKIKHTLLGFVLRFASRIHSVSQDAQDNLLSFFPCLKKERCIVIANGIEVDRFLTPVAKNLRDEVAADSDFLIGFFGRFMGQKGFRYLVDAIEILTSENKLMRQPLVLAFGWGGFVEREQRDIKARGLETFFRFMPFEANIAGAVKGVDVVVMPSLWEACGLLAMETLTCGTPLIATNCIGLREVVANTPALIVPPKEARALADAILTSIQKNSLKDDFSSFVPQAAERYNVEKQYRAIRDELYLS